MFCENVNQKCHKDDSSDILSGFEQMLAEQLGETVAGLSLLRQEYEMVETEATILRMLAHYLQLFVEWVERDDAEAADVAFNFVMRSLSLYEGFVQGLEEDED